MGEQMQQHIILRANMGYDTATIAQMYGFTEAVVIAFLTEVALQG